MCSHRTHRTRRVSGVERSGGSRRSPACPRLADANLPWHEAPAPPARFSRGGLIVTPSHYDLNS